MLPFRGGSVGFIVFSLLVPTEPVPPGQTASLMREPVLLQGPLRLEGPHLDSMWITGTGPFIASFFCCYLKTGWLWCVRACNPALNWEAKAGIGVQDQPSLHSQPSHPVSRKQSRNSLFTAHAKDSTIFKSWFFSSCRNSIYSASFQTFTNYSSPNPLFWSQLSIICRQKNQKMCRLYLNSECSPMFPLSIYSDHQEFPLSCSPSWASSSGLSRRRCTLSSSNLIWGVASLKTQVSRLPLLKG